MFSRVSALILLALITGSRRASEIAMHKARYGRASLPAEIRTASRDWLLAHGELMTEQ